MGLSNAPDHCMGRIMGPPINEEAIALIGSFAASGAFSRDGAQNRRSVRLPTQDWVGSGGPRDTSAQWTITSRSALVKVSVRTCRPGYAWPNFFGYEIPRLRGASAGCG
jgi:hypothetical protein